MSALVADHQWDLKAAEQSGLGRSGGPGHSGGIYTMRKVIIEQLTGSRSHGGNLELFDSNNTVRLTE